MLKYLIAWMKNRRFLTPIIAVLAAMLFFYGLSIFGSLAFGYASTKDFGNQTYAGPFDLSGQNGDEALDKLKSDFTTLQSDYVVNLAYQDAVVALPSELVLFDAEQTVERAKSGEENPIIATVSVDGLRVILSQQFSSLLITEDGVRSIAKGIEQELGTGSMPLVVQLEEYISHSEFAETEIASSSIEVQDLSSSVKNVIKALDGDELAPYSTFSLLDVIHEQGGGPISNRELTLLASVIYTAVLQTNFVVDERNIGSQLTPSVEPGFEATINQQLGLDFIFTNPNKTAFTLHLNFIGESIRSSITGIPLLYTYEPYIGHLETYKPKTVQQFSAFVSDGQVRVADEGREGMEVDVRRLISYEGVVLEDESISSDFYAPLPTIELHPLKKEDQQTTGNVDDGIVEPQENETHAESVNPEKVPDVQLENDESGEIQYDKGGNIIN